MEEDDRQSLDYHKNYVLTADQEMESLHHGAIVSGNVGVFILSDINNGETYLRWVEMIKGCEQRIRHACCFAKHPFVGRISRHGTLWRFAASASHQRVEDITAETSQHAEI